MNAKSIGRTFLRLAAGIIVVCLSFAALGRALGSGIGAKVSVYRAGGLGEAGALCDRRLQGRGARRGALRAGGQYDGRRQGGSPSGFPRACHQRCHRPDERADRPSPASAERLRRPSESSSQMRGSRGPQVISSLLRTGGPLAGEVAAHPLPVAAIARVAPPAAAVAAFVHEYPPATLPGADLHPA
jgi:hypothetical protein